MNWPQLRPVRCGLAAVLALTWFGCSDESRQSGTQAPVQQADKDAFAKSVQVRKQQMIDAKSKSPRSKGISKD